LWDNIYETAVLPRHLKGCFMEDQTDMSTDFDWSTGGLGEDFWRRAAQACTHKPSEVQLRMACGLHAGLNQTESARRAGYVGTNDKLRVMAHRAARSTSVNELLAYAKVETGAADNDIVAPKEARRILSRIARRGDHRARIAALEALAKLDRDEAAAKAGPEENLEEQIYSIIALVPTEEVGAYLAMSTWANKVGNITSFKFLNECAPAISRRYAADWAAWRSKLKPHLHEALDKAASGPLLQGDDLVAAVKGSLPVRIKQTAEADNV
jgi:hypothetical protein